MFYIIRRLINVAAFLVVFITNGCQTCFQSDEYHMPTITTGSAFYQECHCTEPGYNITHLKWLDNNNKIITTGPDTDSNIFVERLSDSINLYITSMSKSMSGTYKCITQYAGREYVQTYNVEAYDPLYFIDTADNQFLVEGRDMSRINCEPKGENQTLIRWFKQSVNFTEIFNDGKYEITSKGLMIKNVTKNDGGVYKCRALVLSTGEEVDRYIKTEVMTIPIIQELKAIPESTVVEGESITIKCSAEGMPLPEYIWNKLPDTDLDNKGNQTWKQIDNTIVLDHVKAEDQGTYECQAYNFAGNVSKTILIEVLIPPKIIDFENITATEGDGIAIVCEATGRPRPNVTVTMKRKNIENEWEDSIITPKVMTLVYSVHEGIYTCNATNEVGFDAKNISVTVLHQPYFSNLSEVIWGWNEKIINLSCVHDSNPPATVTWRFKGDYMMSVKQTEMRNTLIRALNDVPENYLTLTINKNFPYGVYECVAENIHGSSTKTVTIKEAFVPTAVKNISVSYTTATKALFSIDGPEIINGPKIMGYTAEYDKSANYNITNIHVNRTWAIDRPFQLDKLKPNTKYFIRFAALNEVGAGAWSEMLEFDTLEKSVPDAPVWDMDETQLDRVSNYVLKWKVPEDNGDPIDYYILLYCPKNEPFDEKLCKEEKLEPSTELALDMLKPNTTYYLELIAHNVQGNSFAANITLDISDLVLEATILPVGIIIAVPIVVVILCLLLLDLLLLFWRRQGILASCCCKKKENPTSDLQARDKKGLLKSNCESTDNTLRRTDKGHKEYEYNKTTGIITGKHSEV